MVTTFRVLLLSILFGLHTIAAAQIVTLDVFSCKDDRPIQDAYILDESGESILGVSNQEGKVFIATERLQRPLRIKVYKMAALDTIVFLNQSQASICLNTSSIDLTIFEVKTESEDIAESFRRYLDKTINALLVEDTTLVYSFSWKCESLDGDWSMSLDGSLHIPTSSYSKAYSGAIQGNFQDLSFQIDSSFYSSKFFEEVNLNHIAFYFTNCDFLRKGYPYRKKIKDEMILKRSSYSDSTSFIYSSKLKRSSKQYVGYSKFSEDSIMKRNVSDYLFLDTAATQQRDFLYLKERVVQDYELINGNLVLSRIKTFDLLQHKSDKRLLVEFTASLKASSDQLRDGVRIMVPFTKSSLKALSKAEQIILEVQ
ncbi:MAG: hypothetical protein AAGC47_01805 [Bacteroidota bacterium]